MAYTTSYDELFANLMDITESTEPEFVVQIPAIIARAQDVVQRDLGLEIWRTFSPVSTANGVNTITRDPSWLQVHSISIPALGAYPEQRKLDFLRMYGSSSGTPKYWAEVSETSIQLAPTPNAVFALSVEVLARLPALAEDNQTNWLTTHAGDLLLLQALIGAEMYQSSQARVAEFQGAYQLLLAGAQKELRIQERSGYTPTRAASEPSAQTGSHA